MNRSKDNSTVKIREFGLLLKEGNKATIDSHSIPEKAFEWLLANGQSSNDKPVELVRVKKYGKSIALQVVNYVGVLETPCGTRIEILPKISEFDDSESAKNILLKMLTTVNSLSLQQFAKSELQTLKQPLFEVLIGYFLKEVAGVLKKGVRSAYKRVESNKPYLKGQLQTSKQLRQRPGCHNRFHTVHDQFSSDRAENRLIHSALNQVLKWTQSSENHRLGKELRFALDDIPLSDDYVADFRRWSTDRALVHYRNVKPWCELILSYQSPVSLAGISKGISFLFPMETLFERYVAIKLSKILPSDLQLKTQATSRALVTHFSSQTGKEEGWFKLRPDIIVSDRRSNRVVCVADTKWKLINEHRGTAKYKYDISQSDMYQMFAYGHKYLSGCGEMYLIYPKHKGLHRSLGAFSFNDGLNVSAVPYDLLTDECVLFEQQNLNTC